VGRVFAVGLDAAEWSLVEPMARRGELPVLAGLIERGRTWRLTSDRDFRTGIVWEHLISGRGTAAGGRASVVDFDPATYRAVALGAMALPPIWAGAGSPRRTVVFDVPYASLADGSDAIVVTAWGGHDPAYPRASRPAGLLREIDAAVGPHPAAGNDYTAWWHQPEEVAWLATALVEGASRRADAVRLLLERFPDWELFLTVMSEPHSAGEFFWHGVDPAHPLALAPTAAPAAVAMRDVARAVDASLGRMLASLPRDGDTTVVVFSLHGMGPNNGDVPSMVLLPELLHRLQGGRPRLMFTDVTRWRERGCPAIVPPARLSWHDYLLGARLAARTGVGLARLLPLLTLAKRVRQRRDHHHPIPAETSAPAGVPEYSQRWQVPSSYAERWPEMRAFALPTFYDGRVRVNLAGREARGVVPLTDYERTLDWIEGELRAARDVRTGGPVVDDVIRLRAADPFEPGGPDADLVVTWAAGVDAVEHPRAGVIGPVPLRRTGGHSANGFVVVAPAGEPEATTYRNGGLLPRVEDEVLDVAAMPGLLLDQVSNRR
jgi:predicted AlkP superfamily phosphohydrolase/phosphomutase